MNYIVYTLVVAPSLIVCFQKDAEVGKLKSCWFFIKLIFSFLSRLFEHLCSKPFAKVNKIDLNQPA